MLRIFADIPTLSKQVNPLPDGLLWIRGLDAEPNDEFNDFMRKQDLS